MSIDKYLARRYHPKTYNCAHLVCEVWRELKGQEMGDILSGMLTGEAERRTVLSDLRRIRFLDKPESPCVVLFQSPGLPTHVGVMVSGRVLHISKAGVRFQEIKVAAIGFHSVRFFTC